MFVGEGSFVMMYDKDFGCLVIGNYSVALLKVAQLDARIAMQIDLVDCSFGYLPSLQSYFECVVLYNYLFNI